jgi:hypothetical protein
VSFREFVVPKLIASRRIAPRRFEAGIHDLLRFQRPHRPFVVQFAGKNLVRKSCGSCSIPAPWMAGPAVGGVHSAGFDIHSDVVDFKHVFAAVKRPHKIGTRK